MTLWKTMLSVGWCHHQLFIMPFAAISLSNLLSGLNNLTFTFGMWRGRRASRGCCYLCVGRGGGKPHNCGPQASPRGASRYDGRAPCLVPHFERTCRRFTCMPPHPKPRHATPRYRPPRHPSSRQVTCKGKGNKKSACQTPPLHLYSASLQARGGTKSVTVQKKKKEQSRSLTINIYKYINIYIN